MSVNTPIFCDRCGTKAAESAVYCANCGKAFAAAEPLMPRQGRIAGHVRLLGILWLALAAFRIIPGLILILIFSLPFFPPEAPRFLHVMMPALGAMFLIGGALGIVVGCGLLMCQSWARMMAIVLGGISLIDVPFGTALGVYTLWVLLPIQSEQEYRVLSGESPVTRNAP